ncbi:enoyl-CoA hydratase-related protein [Sphingobacterium sp.]|uniref:enoyl-CoA hydratase/isomerase family protein n=1 Tax=Sphingobacterium sp. TaxID=341027 RepID=UPI00289B1EF9|nr:enoyl-CoA hydratase-related protein [Sphingobacterium sp.]
MEKLNFIKVTIEQHVLTMTLARSEKRNAFGPTMVSEIAYVLNIANNNPDVRLVQVEAEGPVFCAGMDLKAFEDPAMDVGNPAIPRVEKSLAELFAGLDKPSICVVRGDVIAGGFLIALSCTYLYAFPQVRFSLPEVKIGLFPFQVLALLLEYMPERKAMDLCIRGASFSAQEALEKEILYGILDVEEKALTELKNTILDNAPLAISKGFSALRRLKEQSFDDKYSFLLDALADLRQTADFKEGMDAMRSKRKANWKNS